MLSNEKIAFANFVDCPILHSLLQDWAQSARSRKRVRDIDYSNSVGPLAQNATMSSLHRVEDDCSIMNVDHRTKLPTV